MREPGGTGKSTGIFSSLRATAANMKWNYPPTKNGKRDDVALKYKYLQYVLHQAVYSILIPSEFLAGRTAQQQHVPVFTHDICY
jgi:hypothetical protein